MKKIRVGVVFGGQSSEHGISLASGSNVAANLNQEKYEIFRILINLDGSWKLTNKEWLGVDSQKTYEPLFNSNAFKNALGIIKKVNVIFLALHGRGGEDGSLQGFLEVNRVPYTGSGILASALSINKLVTKKLLNWGEIKTPKFIALRKEEAVKELFLPAIVKPNDQGSTIGISLVERKKDLAAALKKAFRFSDTVLIEEYIKGLEVTCGVIGRSWAPVVLPLVEIVPKVSLFFDYRAKYSFGGSDEICPARLSKGLTKKIQNIAKEVFQILGCEGMARVDMIITKEEVFTLELNTIPGLTQVSLLPKELAAANIPFEKFLDKQIDISLERYNRPLKKETY